MTPCVLLSPIECNNEAHPKFAYDPGCVMTKTRRLAESVTVFYVTPQLIVSAEPLNAFRRFTCNSIVDCSWIENAGY